MSLMLLSGCSQNSEITNDQKTPQAQTTQQINTQNEISNSTTSTKNKIYTSQEQHFSLEYPASWEIRNTEGIIITANDGKDIWGGTNLNLQYDYQSGDVGMGWKETKKNEEYVNPQGIKFTLFFSGPDEKFYKENNEKIDLNEARIDINTDVMPGLKLFSYNKKTNPDGEKQLMNILKTVKKIQ